MGPWLNLRNNLSVRRGDAWLERTADNREITSSKCRCDSMSWVRKILWGLLRSEIPTGPTITSSFQEIYDYYLFSFRLKEKPIHISFFAFSWLQFDKNISTSKLVSANTNFYLCISFVY